jgi:hypothetical protein
MKNKDNILNASLATEFSQKYLAYALSTITHRALPDVRDGFKTSSSSIAIRYVSFKFGIEIAT